MFAIGYNVPQVLYLKHLAERHVAGAGRQPSLVVPIHKYHRPHVIAGFHQLLVGVVAEGKLLGLPTSTYPDFVARGIREIFIHWAGRWLV